MRGRTSRGVDAGDDLLLFFALPLIFVSWCIVGLNRQMATAPASERARSSDLSSFSSVPLRIESWMGVASRVRVSRGSLESPAVCHTRINRSCEAEIRYLWSAE